MNLVLVGVGKNLKNAVGMGKTEVLALVSRMAIPLPSPLMSFVGIEKLKPKEESGNPLYYVTNISTFSLDFKGLVLKPMQQITIYENMPMEIFRMMAEALAKGLVRIEDIANLEMGPICEMVVSTKLSKKNKYKFISET